MQGEETFSEKIKVEIEAEFTDRMDLCLHEEIAKGTYEEKSFRFINAGFIYRLEFDGKCIIINVEAFISSLMDKMLDIGEKDDENKKNIK